jgi:hypothetical protein
MTPDVVLFIVVMGVLVAGTRLALARPPHWFLLARDHDLKPFTTALAVLSVAGAFLVIEVPFVEAGTYLAAAVVLIALFTMSAARSWPVRAAIGTVSAVAGLAWAVELSWLTYSLAAVFVSIAVITVVRPRLPFWLAAAAMILISADDFIQVSVTQAAVRADTAADPFMGNAPIRSGIVGIPGVIGIPGHLALLSHYLLVLGIGDVTLPGMLIVIAGRAGQLAGTSRLYTAAVAGYGAGLAVCLSVAATAGAAVPATVFLVPGVIVAVAVTARQTGVWSALASKNLRGLAAVDARSSAAEQSPYLGLAEPEDRRTPAQ